MTCWQATEPPGRSVLWHTSSPPRPSFTALCLLPLDPTLITMSGQQGSIWRSDQSEMLAASLYWVKQRRFRLNPSDLNFPLSQSLKIRVWRLWASSVRPKQLGSPRWLVAVLQIQHSRYFWSQNKSKASRVQMPEGRETQPASYHLGAMFCFRVSSLSIFLHIITSVTVHVKPIKWVISVLLFWKALF